MARQRAPRERRRLQEAARQGLARRRDHRGQPLRAHELREGVLLQRGGCALRAAATRSHACDRAGPLSVSNARADASSDSDSDGDDGVDLLSQLRPADEGRLRALEATPIREVPPAATTLASALDPWMQQPTPDAGEHEETTARAAAAVASQEPKARRSLMHRCAPSPGRAHAGV